MEPNTPPTNPAPITPTPEPTPAAPQPVPDLAKKTEEAIAKLPTSAQKVIKKNSQWIVIGCGVVTLAAIIFGAIQLILNIQTQNEMEVLRVELEEKAALVTEYAAQLGLDVSQSNNPNLKPGTTQPDDSNANYIASKNYIYIGEWGIKIRIPKGLKSVSYVFENVILPLESGYTSGGEQVETLYVSGILDEMTYTPEMFQLANNSTGLGALHRTPADQEVSGPAGELVGEVNGYKYWYQSPQSVASSDLEEQKLELKTAELIKQMLTNKNNITRF